MAGLFGLLSGQLYFAVVLRTSVLYYNVILYADECSSVFAVSFFFIYVRHRRLRNEVAHCPVTVEDVTL